MNRFTVEETNLLSIYHEGSKAQLIENMTAALPLSLIHIYRLCTDPDGRNRRQRRNRGNRAAALDPGGQHDPCGRH